VRDDTPPIPGAVYTLARDGSAPSGYPEQPVEDPFSETCFESDYEARRQAFLEHVRRSPAPEHLSAVFHETARMAAGGEPHVAVIGSALDHIDERRDCADFVMHAILRLLHQFPDDPRIPAPLWTRMRASVLGFKYWPDEPGIDSLCSWTENHQILFASAAFLAGGLFPRHAFESSGATGRELRARAGQRILRWLELRFRTGQSEWLSHVYYDEDMTALLSLVDFAEDEELARRAAILLDLFLLDLALHSHRGVFASSHGRSYERMKKWAREESTSDTSKLVFGTGSFARLENMSAPCLALSTGYRVPRVLWEVARAAERSSFEVRQRMGIRVEEGARWGLGYRDLEDGMVWLSMEAYTHPLTFTLFTRLLDAYNWWENEFFRPFTLSRSLLERLRRWRLLPLVARILERDITRNLRPEVNVTTYRTPEYMLSSAQDWRPGFGGDQQHLWQATLGPDAVCFTTHPGPRSARSPSHWTGSASLPRVAQFRNVLICLYRIDRHRPALYVRNKNGYTHAWLPRDRFDEVREQRGWIFARRGQAYLALRSRSPGRWQSEPGEDAGREWVAPGWDAAWICELGSRAEHGSFRVFVERVAGAPLDFGNRQVVYTSPSQGRLELGWSGPFMREGQPVRLGGYPRYACPWVQAAFGGERITVRCGQATLDLRWPEAGREPDAYL
jgi:hypothetical protein